MKLKPQLIFKIKAVLLIIMLFHSCSRKPTTNIVQLEPTIHKELLLGQVNEIIQLETTEESFLEFVSKVNVDIPNNRIFVLSGFNVFIFNAEGKFVTKLTKGKGPGEINMVMSFSLDTENKQFYAIDLANFICVFDYNGNIIRKHQTEFYSLDIHTIDDDNVFLHCNYVGRSEKNFIGKYSFKEKKIIQKYVSAEESPYSILSSGIANKFLLMENRLFYSGANVFGLFELKADTFQRILTYDLGDRAVPESFYRRYVEQRKTGTFGDAAREKNYVPYVISSFYFNNYYLTIIDDEQYSCYAIDEKNKNKVYMNGQLSTYFNLPEVESLKLPRGMQENFLIFSCTPLDFFGENSKEESKEIEIDGQNINVDYDSNPFLIIVK